MRESIEIRDGPTGDSDPIQGVLLEWTGVKTLEARLQATGRLGVSCWAAEKE